MIEEVYNAGEWELQAGTLKRRLSPGKAVENRRAYDNEYTNVTKASPVVCWAENFDYILFGFNGNLRYGGEYALEIYRSSFAYKARSYAVGSVALDSMLLMC